MLGGVAIIASIIGTFAVTPTTGNVERALYQGLIVSGVIAAIAFYPVTQWLMDGVTLKGGGTPGRASGDLYLCSLIGIGVTALPVRDHRLLHVDALRPGQEDRRGLADRPRDEHHPGPRAGPAGDRAAGARPRARHPRRVEARRRRLGGIYGIGVAVMGQLSLTGLIVALDAFGPITDNAGGIAEMADLPEEVRNVTDPLDAVGNTTKAVTKGYAIGSAVLAALVLFAGFKAELAAGAASASSSRSTTRRS